MTATIGHQLATRLRWGHRALPSHKQLIRTRPGDLAFILRRVTLERFPQVLLRLRWHARIGPHPKQWQRLREILLWKMRMCQAET